MNGLSFNIFNILIILATIQGFLLSAVFVFNKKFKKKSNLALAIVLLTIALVGVHITIYDIGLADRYALLGYLPLYFIFGIPIGLYYFVHFLIHPTKSFSNWDYWFMAPLGIQIILEVLDFINYLANPDFYTTYADAYYHYEHFREFLAIAYLLLVIVLVLIEINKYHAQLFDHFSEIEGKDLFWMKKVMWAVLVLWAMWIGSQISYLFFGVEMFYPSWIGLGLLIYWLGYFILLRRDVFEVPRFEDQIVDKKANILSDKTIQHYENLLALMKSEKLYRDPAINMATLSKKMNLSNGYLSQIINQKEGKNFYDFVNTYRVEEVKTNLNHPDFSHYSILGIGLEAGFKSKSTFNAVFKKMTGMTPSAYKKSIKS